MGGKTSVIRGDVWVDSSHRYMHNQGSVEERSVREEEERQLPNVSKGRERETKILLYLYWKITFEPG